LDLITAKGPSARHEIFYFTEGTLSAVRINDYKYRFTDQPGGWLGATVKVDWPILSTSASIHSNAGMYNGKDNARSPIQLVRLRVLAFTFVQQEVGKYAQTFLAYPPMHGGCKLYMSALKLNWRKRWKQQSDRQINLFSMETEKPEINSRGHSRLIYAAMFLRF